MSRAFVRTVFLCGAMCGACAGQAAKSGPEFEVSSVKPAPPQTSFMVASGERHIRMDAGRYEASNQSLLSLISFAYGVEPKRIAGPNWIGNQFYTIIATIPAGSPREEVPAMRQQLLAKTVGR